MILRRERKAIALIWAWLRHRKKPATMMCERRRIGGRYRRSNGKRLKPSQPA
jgi:hypothetical protein